MWTWRLAPKAVQVLHPATQLVRLECYRSAGSSCPPADIRPCTRGQTTARMEGANSRAPEKAVPAKCVFGHTALSCPRSVRCLVSISRGWLKYCEVGHKLGIFPGPALSGERRFWPNHGQRGNSGNQNGASWLRRAFLAGMETFWQCPTKLCPELHVSMT